jgi:hypothetical protein
MRRLWGRAVSARKTPTVAPAQPTCVPLMRWHVVLDDPDLPGAFVARGVEAKDREDAIRRLADAAVEHMIEHDPENACRASIIGAAVRQAYMMYGAAWPSGSAIDLTGRLR